MNLEQGLAIYGAGLATLLAILRGLDTLGARRELLTVEGSVRLVAIHRVEEAMEHSQNGDSGSSADFGWQLIADVTNRGRQKIFLKSVKMRQETRSWQADDWSLPRSLEPGESALFREYSDTARGFRPDLPVKIVVETSKGKVVKKWQQGWAMRVLLRLLYLKAEITGKTPAGRDSGPYGVEYRRFPPGTNRD